MESLDFMITSSHMEVISYTTLCLPISLSFYIRLYIKLNQDDSHITLDMGTMTPPLSGQLYILGTFYQ